MTPALTVARPLAVYLVKRRIRLITNGDVLHKNKSGCAADIEKIPYLFMKFFFLKTVVYASFITKCVKLKNPGEFCWTDKECSSLLCVANICLELPSKIGDECAFFECGGSLACVTEKGKNVCQNPPTQGERCKQSPKKGSICAKNLLCFDGICAKSGNLFTKCSDDERCGSNMFCTKMSPIHKYVCIPKLKKGHRCNYGNCGEGLYCDYKSYVCKKLRSKNQTCNISQNNCKSGYDCMPNHSFFTKFYKPTKCKELPKEGQKCTSKCRPGYFCSKVFTN